MIETKNAEYIYNFACIVKNLNKDNIDVLVNAIVETKNVEYIYYFTRNVKNLSKENKDELLKAIMALKDKIYIAKILYFMKDVNLINKLFGSMDNYVLFCELHKDKLNINIDELKRNVDDLRFSYVDDNIDKYLEKKGNRKVLS